MTNLNPTIARLWLYPVKSLDSIAVEQATILSSGTLKGDRQFALHDQAGKFINGKRNARIHQIRSDFDLTQHRLTLSAPDSETSPAFDLAQDITALEAWLSDYFAEPVSIQQNVNMGFPDDTVSPGPTIISTATLRVIASWYAGLTLEETRRRFRANIEIDGVPAFWEDCLFGKAEEKRSFQIGTVQFFGINPCQRCVVVTRDSQTGVADRNFQKTFIQKRRDSLPNGVEISRFNHYFRLAVNTQIPTSETEKIIKIGDKLSF